MKLSEIAEITSGTLHGEDREFQRVSTDTRSINAGDLFVALSGEKFDAEDFIEQAHSLNACAAVVSRVQENVDLPQIVVVDTTKALGRIARAKREQLNAQVVAITGSCGKTSVRGLLESILCRRGATSATRGNFNNHIGVPLTILAAEDTARYLVVEAGTSAPGEIAYLTEMIDPDVSVLTNIHAAHLEGFGSLEAILEEKSAIFVAGSREATPVVNAALIENYVLDMLDAKEEVIIFSAEQIAEAMRGVRVTATQVMVEDDGCCKFRLGLGEREVDVELTVPGTHQVENSLAAAGCAYALNIDIDDIRLGLQSYTGEKGRMQKIKLTKGLLVDDSYNANPGSMRAAIDFLAAQTDTVLVLGDMGELGDISERAHREIGAYAKDRGIGELVVLGDFSAFYAEGFGSETAVFSSRDEIVTYLSERLNDLTTILVKGSRSAHMDRVCQGLINERGKI